MILPLSEARNYFHLLFLVYLYAVSKVTPCSIVLEKEKSKNLAFYYISPSSLYFRKGRIEFSFPLNFSAVSGLLSSDVRQNIGKEGNETCSYSLLTVI
jgi:hypothetical protein